MQHQVSSQLPNDPFIFPRGGWAVLTFFVSLDLLLLFDQAKRSLRTIKNETTESRSTLRNTETHISVNLSALVS
jgi:hypothetical protein